MDNNELKTRLFNKQPVMYEGKEYDLLAIEYKIVENSLVISAKILRNNSITYVKAKELE